MQKYIILNSVLYSVLLREGGDELISVYSILKYFRRHYKPGKLKGYKQLQHLTKLSQTTLRKYVPQLIQLGLCYFDVNGIFNMIGNNKINKLYTKNKRVKLVPIEIDTYIKTKLFSFRVRIFKAEQEQKNRIDRRTILKNIIGKHKKKIRLSDEEFKLLKSMKDKDWEYINSNAEYNGRTVLSLRGFSKLKNSERISVSSGAYWRTKLVSAGIIKTKRNIKRVRKCTKQEYQQIKKFDKRYSFYKGQLYREFPARFTTTEFIEVLNPPQEVKKLEHLSFDFVHWLSKQ